MIKKKKRRPPLGISEDLPEGIYGYISKKDRRPNIVPKNRDIPVGRELFGWSPEHKIALPPEVPRKKKKAKKVKPSERTIRLKDKARKKEAKFKAKAQSRILPNFDINYDSELPKEARHLNLQNVVRMDERALRSIIDNTETTSQALSALMLQTITPAVLAFDASSSYVKAVLSAGLKIDTEVDRGIAEIIQDLSRLEVVNFYVNRMNLDPLQKRRLIRRFIDGFSERSLAALAKADKGTQMSQQIRELEGVLVRNSERKKTGDETHDQRKKRERNGGGAPDEIAVPDSIRRTRRDTPRSGGF